MQKIKQLHNGSNVIFDQGRFDAWCVYIVAVDGHRVAPSDVVYFSDLKMLNERYGNNKVYLDFVKIYLQTGSTIDENVLLLIDQLVATYHISDQNLLQQWLVVIYAGMVAEENKTKAILKKRIKHLGVYQALVLGLIPEAAAKFSLGKSWRELDVIMKQYNI